jgi:hypothetical protein
MIQVECTNLLLVLKGRDFHYFSQDLFLLCVLFLFKQRLDDRLIDIVLVMLLETCCVSPTKTSRHAHRVLSVTWDVSTVFGGQQGEYFRR